MEPLFYQGQRVVFLGVPHEIEDKDHSPLIEGKSYYVINPYVKGLAQKNSIFIELSGITSCAFDQRGFVPYDTDCQLESEIFESLKGQPIKL